MTKLSAEDDDVPKKIERDAYEQITVKGHGELGYSTEVLTEEAREEWGRAIAAMPLCKRLADREREVSEILSETLKSVEEDEEEENEEQTMLSSEDWYSAVGCDVMLNGDTLLWTVPDFVAADTIAMMLNDPYKPAHVTLDKKSGDYGIPKDEVYYAEIYYTSDDSLAGYIFGMAPMVTFNNPSESDIKLARNIAQAITDRYYSIKGAS